MPTDRDIADPSETTPGTAAGIAALSTVADHTDATAGASQPDDEATMPEREGFAHHTLTLAPASAAPPLRCPGGV